MAKVRTVRKNSDGEWLNNRNDAERAGSKHARQAFVISAARDMLTKAGNGELTVKRVDGKITSTVTIAPGNDPNLPRDTEY